jgi:hypothetical protein
LHPVEFGQVKLTDQKMQVAQNFLTFEGEEEAQVAAVALVVVAEVAQT